MWWSKRQTLLVISQNRVARLEYRSTHRCTGSWTCQRPSGTNVREAVELAIESSSAALHSVWILADDFWSGIVSLADDVVQSIPASALSQAIAFELEYDSGLDPFSTRLDYVPVPADKSRKTVTESQWQALQVEDEQLQSLKSLVARHRGKLLGVASIAEPPRTEANTTTISGYSDELTDERLAAWGLNWLRSTSDPNRAFPLINMNSQAWTDADRRRASMAILGCAVCACGIHYTTARWDLTRQQSVSVELQTRQKKLSVEVGRLQALAAQSNSALGKSQQLADQERERLVKLEQQRRQWKQDRRLPAELLAALEATASPRRCITSLRYTRDSDIVLQGIGVANDDAMALVVQLEKQLTSSPWTVLPPKIQMPMPAGPVQFTIHLRIQTNHHDSLRARTARRARALDWPVCDVGGDQGGDRGTS